MSPVFKLFLLSWPALLPAVAQSVPPAIAPQAATSAPYRSAFEGYRPFAADEVQDWRRSNDDVREAGGWRAYAREISGTTGSSGSPAQPAGSAPAAPGKDPHAGHHP